MGSFHCGSKARSVPRGLKKTDCLLSVRASRKSEEIEKLEAEAEQAIEEAERLWKEALEARTLADELCSDAEGMAQETEESVGMPGTPQMTAPTDHLPLDLQ